MRHCFIGIGIVVLLFAGFAFAQTGVGGGGGNEGSGGVWTIVNPSENQVFGNSASIGGSGGAPGPGLTFSFMLNSITPPGGPGGGKSSVETVVSVGGSATSASEWSATLTPPNGGWPTQSGRTFKVKVSGTSGFKERAVTINAP